MVNEQSLKNKLIDEVNKGYIDLSKWMIGLATGAIVFSVRLIKTDTPQYLNILLILGLGFLVLSVISGVVFVRLRIDALHCQLLKVTTSSDIAILKAESELEHMGENKVKEVLQNRVKINKAAKRKYKIINNFLVFVLPVQQWSFFLGLIIISIFGVSILL